MVRLSSNVATQCFKNRPLVQWTSHPPQRQEARVRIPPEDKVFRENIAILLCLIDLICIVYALKKEIKALEQKVFFNRPLVTLFFGGL
jgi:hypothetical protein